MSEIVYGPVYKRTVDVGRIKTSISIEEVFWNQLKKIAKRRDATISQIVTDIDFDRSADNKRGTKGNLSSAIRQFVLRDAMDRADELETRMASVLPSQGAQAGAPIAQ